MADVFTLAGEDAVAAKTGGVGTPPADFDYIAVGTGTNAAATSDTELQTEITDSGLARAQVTPTSSANVLTLTKTWTASGSKNVTECGVLNAAADGTLLGRSVFTAIPMTSGDSLAITFNFRFGAAR